LLQWLNSIEAGTVNECVASEIALLESEAFAQAMAHPQKVIGSEAIPPDAVAAFKKAARLKLFLDVLAEISKPGFLFRRARLSLAADTTKAPENA
jgi:hypothetical protein